VKSLTFLKIRWGVYLGEMVLSDVMVKNEFYIGLEWAVTMRTQGKQKIAEMTKSR
jgi:hypothetical protein